jgi:cell wall-associated NlpC family hydrolase
VPRAGRRRAVCANLTGLHRPLDPHREGSAISRKHLIAAVLAVSILVSAAPAAAAPLASKRAEAERIKVEIDRLDEKMDVAVEDYNEANLRYSELKTRVAKNQSRLKQLNGTISTLQTSLEVRVDSMYRNGPLGTLDVLFGTTSFEDFASTWDLLNQFNEQEAASVAQLKATREEVRSVEADLESSGAQAKTQLAAVAKRRTAITSDLARRAGLLKGLEAEIAQLQAEARARALQAARRTQTKKRPASGSTGGWDWGNPTKAPRGQVVTIARRYLGRPYRWAASGPGSFDCSGFTMFVYAQVGVSLPHSSRAQISSGQRVSRANLQPGDLVFFGRPIHHVGIYVGGGMFIHSPRTGDVVSVDPLLSDFSGACRP